MNKILKMMILIFTALFIAYFFFNQWKSKHDTFITSISFETYQKTEHEIPYIFKLSKPNQCLFYFGANHSHDPNNEQYPKLTELWQDFLQKTQEKNCIVLIEGGTRSLRSTKDESIIKDGEAGYISFLAHHASIPCLNTDPNDKYLETKLLKKFKVDDVYFMRFTDIWHQFNEHKKNESSLNFSKYLKKFHAFLGNRSLHQFKKIHQQIFDEPFDVDNEEKILSAINLENETNIIGKIHRYNNQLRDEYVINQIKQQIKQGKNIFVVFGATHAIMQEPEIKKIWNT